MNSKLPQNMKEIITAFNDWYKNDDHSKKEDSYKSEINYEYLNGLKKDEFISFLKSSSEMEEVFSHSVKGMLMM